MCHPSEPQIAYYNTVEDKDYTISALEKKTNSELKSICSELGISYNSTDTKDKLVALIANKNNLKYKTENLENKTLANLKNICDGLGIIYSSEATEEDLKALILA